LEAASTGEFVYSDGSVVVDRAESMVRQAAVDLMFAYSQAYALSASDKRALQRETIKSVERVVRTARRFRRASSLRTRA
jgi:hypothetical protein